MENTKDAFHWIIGIVKKNNIPFQVTGGLAAKLYGSSRELADIDIEIPEDKFQSIIPNVKNYIVFGPERYIDDNWDLLLMTLEYKGSKIDISGGDTIRIRRSKNENWQKNPTSFSKFTIQNIYGIKVPVVKKDKLIEYKKILSRPVDIEDIKEMSNL